MDEYKDGISTPESSTEYENQSNEEKIDSKQKNSIEYFTHSLTKILEYDEKEEYQQELEVYNQIYQLFKEDEHLFPIDFCQNIPFFDVLFRFLQSIPESQSTNQLIFKIVDSVIRESPHLCTQFVESNLLNALFQFLINDNYFSQLLNIFSYCISTCDITITKIISEENASIYAAIEDAALQSNWQDLDAYLCQDIITFLSLSIIHFPSTEEQHFNNVLSILLQFLDVNTYANAIAAACQGIVKILTAFPNFLPLLLQSNIIPKIIGLLNKYGPDNSIENVNITRMVMGVLVIISYINVDDNNLFEIENKESFLQNAHILFEQKTNTFTDVFSKSIEETPDFFQTLFNCCTHSNVEISKNAFMVINNLTYHSVFNTADLAEHNFGNLLLCAMTEGTYQMKNNAITSILDMAIFADPQEIMKLVLPETLSVIASDASSISEMQPQNLIKAIGLILMKLHSVGLGEQAEECFRTEEFYSFLEDVINTTSDDEVREKASAIEAMLGFVESDE